MHILSVTSADLQPLLLLPFSLVDSVQPHTFFVEPWFFWDSWFPSAFTKDRVSNSVQCFVSGVNQTAYLSFVTCASGFKHVFEGSLYDKPK